VASINELYLSPLLDISTHIEVRFISGRRDRREDDNIEEEETKWL
jgi:hypothetical protein